MMASTALTAPGHGNERNSIWRRRHDAGLITDPDGYIADFGYDIARRTWNGHVHNSAAWAARQARMASAFASGVPLSHAVPQDDFVHHAFLVPDCAPFHLADPQAFWTEIDKRDLGPSQHLWAGPTIWFPAAPNWHVPVRRVREFIQTKVVDVLHTPAHLFVHDPGLIGKAGDLHVHVMISVQKVGPRGFVGWEPALIEDGCQRGMWTAWS
ncbi:MAG: hypothetical protein B7Y35_14040 [Sphingomonadales bacterium 28-64-96]|nr:MAG: hypothetical protein B7Y35_14040 [Sphingomonadales bacterium 28-64-96]